MADLVPGVYRIRTDKTLKDGTEMSVTLSITVGDGISFMYSNITVDPEERGIKLSEVGEMSVEYNIDELWCAPSNVRMTLFDKEGYLTDLLLAARWTDLVMSEGNRIFAQPKVEIFLGGELEFNGTIFEDTVDIDKTKRMIEFEVAPVTEVLSKINLYDQDGRNLNPLGYIDGTVISVVQIINDIYKKIDPDMTVEIFHNWVFQGE